MVDRPDLDEFLGALSGFVSNKNTNTPPQQDPGYFRFLEIFCRSVGSSEGHLLQHNGKELQSVVSSGVPKEFDKQFNDLMTSTPAGSGLSPLDRAFRDQQVTAVVELKRDSGVPPWFLDFMGKLRYKALVAVPLIGQTRAVGVLCAYYRDVCLFDQGTLDRLMTIGRMVGAAIENSAGAAPIEASPAVDGSIDSYLTLLTGQSSTQLHVFDALTKVATKALAPSGLICGPLRMAADGVMLTIANGTGVPPTAVSQRFVIPAVLAQQIMMARGNHRQASLGADALGAFKPLIPGKSVATICQPIVWRKQPQAALIAWRAEKNPFTEQDEILLGRLSGISSLVLRAL